MVESNNKPCLVNTPQGFSVSYRQKLLYSKYNPSRTLLQNIESLNILPGTLILCCSPVLDYGLEELMVKCGENSCILLCEADKELNDFSINNSKSCLPRLTLDEIYNLPVILNKKSYKLHCGFNLPEAGSFKRILRIDCSAGVSFYSEFYDQLSSACTQAIMTFWSNRVTLTKFGRRYSQDFFKNFKQLAATVPINSFIKKIENPIIVCGAGESLDLEIENIRKVRKSVFLLCADTALNSLIARGITPDGVFVEEAQQIISKAFLGLKNCPVHLFLSLSALNQMSHIFVPQQISYFTTLYTDSDFIYNIQKLNILPHMNKPFGSVGLTAVYYALQFRKNDSIPVYCCGLDFSYSAGKTHAKETMAHKNALLSSNKLKSLNNYGASFNQHSLKIAGKDGKCFFTMPVMNNYARMFNSFFGLEKNLFDSGKCGVNLGIPRKEINIIEENNNSLNITEFTGSFSTEDKEQIATYLLSEKQALKRLKDILTGELEISAEKQEEEIKNLVEKREYLFLHFPDGWKFQYNQSFLNRIRTELEGFLKILD